MKKILSSVMEMCIFVASAFGFSACSEQEEGHIHDFTGEFIEVGRTCAQMHRRGL